MPPNPVMAGRCPNRHHPRILDEATSEPARQAGLDSAWSSRRRSPQFPHSNRRRRHTRVARRPLTPRSRTRFARRSHTRKQRNPQWRHRYHSRADSTSTSRRSTESASTPLTRTPDKCKRTDITSDIEASPGFGGLPNHRFQRGLNPIPRVSTHPPHISGAASISDLRLVGEFLIRVANGRVVSGLSAEVARSGEPGSYDGYADHRWDWWVRPCGRLRVCPSDVIAHDASGCPFW